MITACLQTLKVTTKGDVCGTKAEIRLVLPQGAPISAILFLIYINDLKSYCPRAEDRSIKQQEVGKEEIILTADDFILYTSSWGALQYWLDACAIWAHKNTMKWESNKCAIICDSEADKKGNKDNATHRGARNQKHYNRSIPRHHNDKQRHSRK